MRVPTSRVRARAERELQRTDGLLLCLAWPRVIWRASIDLPMVALGSSAALADREGLMLEVGPVLIYITSEPHIGG